MHVGKTIKAIRYFQVETCFDSNTEQKSLRVNDLKTGLLCSEKNKGNHLHCRKRRITYKSGMIILPFKALMSPHEEHCAWSWALSQKTDIHILGMVQRGATRSLFWGMALKIEQAQSLNGCNGGWVGIVNVLRGCQRTQLHYYLWSCTDLQLRICP